jgi:hypothetical protein
MPYLLQDFNLHLQRIFVLICQPFLFHALDRKLLARRFVCALAYDGEGALRNDTSTEAKRVGCRVF